MTSDKLPFTNCQSTLGGDNESAWHNANHEYGHVGSRESVMPIAARSCTRRHFPSGCRVRPTYEELPPEIRKAVSRWQSPCGPPLAATHLFAHYLDDRLIGSRLISLHFHELSCANKSGLCSYEGCLHRVYVSTDGRYQLAFSAHVPEVTLTLVDHTPAIEIDCGLLAPRCPRVLRWDGGRFVER